MSPKVNNTNLLSKVSVKIALVDVTLERPKHMPALGSGFWAAWLGLPT